MIWVLIGSTSALVILALVYPFLRRDGVAAADGLGVFKGQLAELERDRELGLIGEDEARQVELDINRRLLAAQQHTDLDGAPSARLRQAGIAFSALAAMGAVAIYMSTGNPQLIGQAPPQQAEIPEPVRELVTEVNALAERLMQNPDDPDGWTGLGQAYLALGRFGEAAIAFNNAINSRPDSAELFALLGQAYVFSENGALTPAAREAFSRAVELDPEHLIARVYLAEAVLQDGDLELGASLLRALRDEMQEGDPARQFIDARLAALSPPE
ncbi:c-type cytochrome biogenesis protein CcmI [Maricaulis sp.]|uniref:c-type cytochrome biogenesis protein CcmI n=1 Tax=Maricaulis sp. TaxID=1486257 RepID=UPI002611CF4C|nr:c-type cytochrome biogenesis protein CcmI [Maricaulis sp.]